MQSLTVEHPFESRPTRRCGVREMAGWRMRLHAITLPGEDFDWHAFGGGLDMAAAALPPPAVAAGRPGVGFIIALQGRRVDYLVVCWWARENELPLRVFVRDRAPASAWRAAEGEESICVWDLEVIRRERDAYVATVLSKSGPADAEAYLGAL